MISGNDILFMMLLSLHHLFDNQIQPDNSYLWSSDISQDDDKNDSVLHPSMPIDDTMNIIISYLSDL